MPVYVVDDNPDMCEFLDFMLSEHGYSVHAFTRPAVALSHMQDHQLQPNMLITDYNMPGMNGSELHQHVSRHAPDVKTIVISGRSALNLSDDLHFLQKPFPPGLLLSLMKTLERG